jgi:bis(5'-nucleosidyl)-tetraphosphatase
MNKQRLSAGVVVVRRRYSEWSYLLLRSWRYWDFPKGMVEENETPLEAACREVYEESNLVGLQFYWGHHYYQTPPYNRGKVARYYMAESPAGDVSLPISEELGRPEHEEFRWVSISTGMEMLTPRVQPVLQWASAILAGADGTSGTKR